MRIQNKFGLPSIFSILIKIKEFQINIQLKLFIQKIEHELFQGFVSF
jgi:hypothetical protein